MTDFSDQALLKQRQLLREMAQGFRQAQILLTCVELGAFEALNDGPATACEVAQALGADLRGMELLLNAAAALGLLDKNADHFSNKPLVAACLLPGTPGTMARSFRMQAAFYQRWGRLAEAVRTGKRPEENRRDEEPASWIENFVNSLYNMALPVAPAVAESLALPEDRPLRLIDVGGCHGAYSMALAQRYPRLTATVFELPRVVPVARQIIARAGMADRVSVQSGNFQKEELGQGYDVALVFGVLNGEPPDGRPALIRKVFRALEPGGQIVLRDFALDPDRAGPPEAAIFALQMLLATEAGGLDTRDDWDEWLAEAGFLPPKEIELPWIGSSLTIAQKP
jgi:hypothetical protein